MNTPYREVDLVAGEQLVITASDLEKKRKDLPPFKTIGDRREVRGVEQGIDLLKAVLEMTSDERWLFKILLNEMNYKTNLSSIRHYGFTPSENNKRSSGYKKLYAKGLIKRVKPKLYMINPDAIIYVHTYIENKKEWLSIK